MKTPATEQSQSPVGQALVKALPEGSVLFDDDVTSRSAGIWRSDTLKARILVKPRTTEENLWLCRHRNRVQEKEEAEERAASQA